MKTILFVLAFVTVTAHAQRVIPEELEMSQDYAEVQRIIRTAKSLAADDIRCRRNADCVVIGLGSAGCGGPSTYTYTSVRNTRLGEVRRLARVSEIKADEYLRNHRVISPCVYIDAPKVRCLERRRCIAVGQ